MQHTFASSDGPVEVNLSKQGDSFFLQGHELVKDTRGRLRITLQSGHVHVAHAAKVGDTWWVHINGRTFKWERIEPGSSNAQDEGGLVAPMPGKVLEVLVSEGDKVAAGEPLMVLEAMKMEHRIVASTDGTVIRVNYRAGDQVDQGASLLEVE